MSCEEIVAVNHGFRRPRKGGPNRSAQGASTAYARMFRRDSVSNYRGRAKRRPGLLERVFGWCGRQRAGGNALSLRPPRDGTNLGQHRPDRGHVLLPAISFLADYREAVILHDTLGLRPWVLGRRSRRIANTSMQPDAGDRSGGPPRIGKLFPCRPLTPELTESFRDTWVVVSCEWLCL